MSISETGVTRSYGVIERGQADSTVAQWAEQIRLAGYVVVPGAFSSNELADFSVRLDQVMERQVEEFGSERLAAIGDTLTARCPLAYDEAFVRLATHPDVLALCRELLGDYIVLMQQNGVINPGRLRTEAASAGQAEQSHTQQSYHRDLPYQHFTSSRPLAVSALFCIDAFRPDTGATTVIPASHRLEAFPSEEVVASLETAVAAESGSFIVFDAMLFHRAGANRSDRPRRAVNQVYSLPFIAQQISLADVLPPAYASDPALARLFGLDTAPARSVTAWRERRLARTARPNG